LEKGIFLLRKGFLLFKKASCLASRLESFVCWVGTMGLGAVEGIAEVAAAVFEDALVANLVRLDVFAITKGNRFSCRQSTKIDNIPWSYPTHLSLLQAIQKICDTGSHDDKNDILV